MKNIRLAAFSLAAVLTTSGIGMAGIFKLDFASLAGEAEGWDVFETLVEDEVYMLTDTAGSGDDDVEMTVINGSESALSNFTGNNPEPPTESFFVDDIEIPVDASGDYLYRNPDTAGTSALFRFQNLNPGDYRVSLFEGRMSDAQQFAVLWVGDENGSNEPAAENTGNFAGMQNLKSFDLTIGEGQLLWYRHLEDNSGGVSGMVIRQLRAIDVLPGDFNEDGQLDTADFMVMTANFNQPGKFSDGDMNFDGMVDLADFLEFRHVFNASSQVAAIPEPAASSLVWLACLGVAAAGRRRDKAGRLG